MNKKDFLKSISIMIIGIGIPVAYHTKYPFSNSNVR